MEAAVGSAKPARRVDVRGPQNHVDPTRVVRQCPSSDRRHHGGGDLVVRDRGTARVGVERRPTERHRLGRASAARVGVRSVDRPPRAPAQVARELLDDRHLGAIDGPVAVPQVIDGDRVVDDLAAVVADGVLRPLRGDGERRGKRHRAQRRLAFLGRDRGSVDFWSR